jgi:hypothetical protein
LALISVSLALLAYYFRVKPRVRQGLHISFASVLAHTIKLYWQ